MKRGGLGVPRTGPPGTLISRAGGDGEPAVAGDDALREQSADGHASGTRAAGAMPPRSKRAASQARQRGQPARSRPAR